LEKVVRQVPYDKQEEFFLGFDGPGSAVGAAANIDW
jgi:hypothetical protein